MAQLSVLEAEELCRLLERLGFVPVRQRGSHRRYVHPDGRRTTVPCNAGYDLSPILLRRIAKDIGLAVEGVSRLASATGGARPTRRSVRDGLAAGVRAQEVAP